MGAGARDGVGGATTGPGTDVRARDVVDDETPKGVPQGVVAGKAGGGGKAGVEGR